MPGDRRLRIARVGCGSRGLGVWLPAIRMMSDVFELAAVCDTTCPDVGLQLIDLKTGKHETLCFSGSSNGGSQRAKTVPENDHKTRPETYGSQWSHSRPSFSPDGKRVIYTSDRTGVSQIYFVDVAVWGTSPN